MSPNYEAYLASLNVVIVDDSRSFLAGMSSIVSPHLARVEAFTSVSEALMSMLTTPPDILITDIEMPDLNGFDFIKTIRSNAIFSDMPILVLTGKEDGYNMTSAIQAGADAFLIKSTVRECVLPQLVALARLQTTFKTATKGKQLDAVQALIGTYKHEFGNALAAIDGKVRKLTRTFPETAKDDSIESVHKWIGRMVDTLKKLDELRQYEEKKYVGTSTIIETE